MGKEKSPALLPTPALQRRRPVRAEPGAAQGRAADVVRPDPLYDQIYEILWQKILNLEITAGTRLRDIEWAEKLNVSRTPVREALRKLQKDGMLEALSNGRYVLKRIGSNDLRALYRCRAALEALAIRDLAGRITPREATKLQALVDETVGCLASKDYGSVFALHSEFHERLTQLCGNTYLLALLETLRRLILYARASLRTFVDADKALSEAYARQVETSQVHHTRIMASIAARDFDGAAAQMEAHLFETAEDMCQILDQVPAPDAK
jgi:DNA-binding GntR family transcriptional regulator